jgi:hypothetical protein
MCDRAHLASAALDVKRNASLCADLIHGRISPTETRAIFARQRAALKMLELQLKFGNSGKIKTKKLIANK